MAKSKTVGGGDLNYTAKLHIDDAKKHALELKKLFAEVGIAGSKTHNRAAHFATMDALQKEKLAILQLKKETAQLTLIEKERTIELKKQADAAKQTKGARRPTSVSNSQPEIDAYYSTTNGSKEVISTLNEQNKAQIAAAASASQLTGETKKVDVATKQSNVSKKDSAKLLAEEKYIQQQNTKELKNRVREELNAKGSLEQRRAALIRLQTAYDRLSVSERNSAAGQRLSGIIGRVHAQVLDLEKVTGRTGRNVGNYLSLAWGGLKQIANILPGLGIAGLLAFAIEPLMNYVKGLDLFKSKASDLAGAQKDIASKMGASGEAAAKATLEVAEMKNSFQAAREGLISKASVLKDYNTGLGKVLGVTKEFNLAEERTLKNGDAYIDLMFKKATAASLMALYTEQMGKAQAELAKTDDDAVDYFSSGLKGKGLKNAKGEDMFEANAQRNKEAAARPFKERAEVIKTLWVQENAGIKKFIKDNRLKFEETELTDPKTNPELNARNILQKKINDLIDQSKKKQLSADEQEVESVRLKYAGMRKELEEYYAKYKKLRVNTTGLDDAEKAERDAILYKQGTETLKKELEQQKQLQADYETFRNDFGEQKAQERFGKEVNYLERLQDERKKIIGSNDRSKYLDEEIKKEEAAEQKRNDDLLKQFQTYGNERALLVEKYEKISTDLRAKGFEDQARLAEDEGRKQAQELDDKHIKEWDTYKNLFDNLEKLSRKETTVAIEEMEKRLKAAGIVSTELEKLKKEFSDPGIIDKKRSESLREAAEQLGRIASQFNDINGNIGSITSVLVTAASAYVEILKGMEDFNTAQADGDNLGKITAGLGIAGAAINVATSIVKFFKAAKESAKQAAAEMQKFQDDAIKGELAYNSLLRERERTLKDISKLTIADLRNQQQLLTGQTTQAERDYNRLLGLLRTSGQQITGQHTEKTGGFLGIGRKTKTVEDTAGVAGLSYEQLEALFTQGKLTESTSKWFSELQKAKAEMEAIGVSGQDVIDAINQVATGTTSNGIADAIIAGFRQGKRSAADFADDFKGLMTDAALSVFKSNFLNKAIEGFYKDFATASEDGLSEQDVQTLRDAYSKIITDGAAKLADFDKIVGGNSATPGSGGLTGAIARGITEETAGLIVGQFNGMRLLQIETNSLLAPIGKSVGDLYLLARDNFDTQLKIEANTLRTANNTDQLAEMKSTLKSIDTKMSNASNNLAAGGRI